MQTIPTPTKIDFREETDKTATIIVEPFYPGYGTTVGNALRRVLLSSLPGAAVTAFKLKNALHEFSTVEHVKEDIVEISLNLKKLHLKVHSNEPIRLMLKAKGEKKVTGKDIEPNSDVEVINKDLHIATLTDKNAEMEMELVVSSGRGYQPTEAREEELEVGMIAIDSIFTPMQKVNFKVESVRVGQMTNWDRLILDIETDGSITPREAIATASKYLIEHFNFIETSTLAKEEPKDETEEKEEKKEEKADEEEEAKDEPKEETEEKPKKKGRPRKKKEEDEEEK